MIKQLKSKKLLIPHRATFFNIKHAKEPSRSNIWKCTINFKTMPNHEFVESFVHEMTQNGCAASSGAGLTDLPVLNWKVSCRKPQLSNF